RGGVAENGDFRQGGHYPWVILALRVIDARRVSPARVVQIERKFSPNSLDFRPSRPPWPAPAEITIRIRKIGKGRATRSPRPLGGVGSAMLFSVAAYPYGEDRGAAVGRRTD